MVKLVLTPERWKFVSATSAIISNLVDKLCSCSNLFSKESFNLSRVLSKNVQANEFRLSNVTEDFLYKELYKVNSAESTVMHTIPARFVKDTSSVLTRPITHIVYLSIEQNIVPKELKNPWVVTLFKKNKRCEIGKYRSVSVLSVAS